MWIVLTIIGLLLVGGLVYLATLNGQFHVRRKLECDLPIDQVFNTIRDFNSWRKWSPWLLHEPEATVEISDDCTEEGGYYCWDGEVVGAGKLSHVSISVNKSIQQRIEFTRPFKSVNRVNWYFEERGNKTLVEWEMEGSMPFLFRFMTATTESMVSRDYDLGLALLLGYLEPDKAHPQMSFRGKQTLEDFYYWSIPFTGRLRELQVSRKTSLTRLEKEAEDQAGLSLSIYRKIDWQQVNFAGEFAVPVAGDAENQAFPTRKFKGGIYFQAELLGDHQFLPLAWYAAFSHCRMHKIKLDKSRPFLEIYHRGPESIKDNNQIRTILYLPIKA